MNEKYFGYIKLHDSAKGPEKIAGNCCYDLSYCGEEITFKFGERLLLGTGIILIFPPKYHGIIKPRSGLAYKNGLDIMAGVIDNSFDKETKILVINLCKEPYTIHNGDRIAQIQLVKDETFTVKEFTLDQLKETGRGPGFGSSGK